MVCWVVVELMSLFPIGAAASMDRYQGKHPSLTHTHWSRWPSVLTLSLFCLSVYIDAEQDRIRVGSVVMVVMVKPTSFFLIGATASMDRYQGRQKRVHPLSFSYALWSRSHPEGVRVESHIKSIVPKDPGPVSQPQ